MPGPNSGIAYERDTQQLHAACQQKQSCKGPGCRLRTGKTYANRKAKRGTAFKIRTTFYR